MKLPWRPGPQLAPGTFAKLRRQAIFDCCKWDPQVEDVSTLCDFPLLLLRSEWDILVSAAESLEAETIRAEAELVTTPALHKMLGFSRPIRKALLEVNAKNNCTSALRIIRFDFHYTTEGWKISEANTDVPGGFIEASGFTALMAEHFPKTVFTNPATRLAEAITSKFGKDATVALVHATSFADDRQVMVFLARAFESKGIKTVLAAPDHLRWKNGDASITSAWFNGPVDFVFRFFSG